MVESTVPNLREDPTVEDGEEGENPRLHTEKQLQRLSYSRENIERTSIFTMEYIELYG